MSELPEIDLRGPPDMEAKDRHWFGAQAALQGVGVCLGFPHKGDQVAIPTDDLYEALGSAIAMILSADDRLGTPRDVRVRAEQIAKYAADMAKVLRSTDNQTGQQIMQAFRIGMAEIPLN